MTELSRLRPVKFSFAAGTLTAFSISLVMLLFWRTFGPIAMGSSGAENTLQQFAPELAALGAVTDGMSNSFAGSVAHDNFLVHPDDILKSVLRADVKASGYFLDSPRRNLNLDPPVLYVSSNAVLSDSLKTYLARVTRLTYTFSTDSEGFRTTLPAVSSTHRILMIGDSIAFGLGVDDHLTIASQLQQRAGDSLRVVNAAVGGYGAEQIYEVARKNAEQGTYDALIYVACTNDFNNSSKEAYLSSASDLLGRLAALKPRFSNRVIVILQGYMEYTLRDVFGGDGWPESDVAKDDYLRAQLPAVARAMNFEYIDWVELANRSTQEQGTIFGRFGLYVDDAHFSPKGNELAATSLILALRRLGVAPSVTALTPDGAPDH